MNRHEGEPGYLPCPRCGRWVRPNPEGRTYPHTMLGWTRPTVACMGGWLDEPCDCGCHLPGILPPVEGGCCPCEDSRVVQ